MTNVKTLIKANKFNVKQRNKTMEISVLRLENGFMVRNVSYGYNYGDNYIKHTAGIYCENVGQLPDAITKTISDFDDLSKENWAKNRPVSGSKMDGPVQQ